MKKVVHICHIFILTGIISFLFSFIAKSQTYQDSCFRLIWEHNPEMGYFNPDSVLIDSCQCPDMLWEYCPYLYANRWYKLYLPNGAINLPAYPHDATIFVTWQDIDTNFVELRQKFQEMESIFGKFLLKKVYPGSIDTVSSGSRFFVIKFDNYYLIDSVVQFLKTFPEIEDPGYTYHLANFSNVKNSDNTISEFYVSPIPSNGIINIEFNLETHCHISINLYDLSGNKISNLKSDLYNTGQITENLLLENISNGSYFLKIESLQFNKIFKIIINK